MGKNELILKAKKRELLGKKVKTLRMEGQIPVVLYGKATPSESLTVNEIEFNKIFSTAGSSSLIELNLDDKNIQALIKNVSIHPITQRVEHVEFYRINMKNEIMATIPIELIGESPAVKNNVGLLFAPTEEVDIKCLPADLPKTIEVSIDKLENIGDTILVKDLVLPKGVEIDSGVDQNQPVAMIEEPQMEESAEEIQLAAIEDVEITTEKVATEEEAPAATEE